MSVSAVVEPAGEDNFFHENRIYLIRLEELNHVKEEAKTAGEKKPVTHRSFEQFNMEVKE